MKEVLTKSFWQGVKKTFYDAMEESHPEKFASQAPAAEEKANPLQRQKQAIVLTE